MTKNTSKKTNLYIVFEGINGAGKSTTINGLVDFLKAKNKRVLQTKEPGSPHIKLGAVVAGIVKEGLAGKITPQAESLLFAADRFEHAQSVVLPALNRGEFVVSDRFVYSSIAFQGFARGLGRDFIEKINQVTTDLVRPDLVFLFDISVEKALQRISSRSTEGNAERDIFEDENIKFHQTIRDAYLLMAKENPDIFVLIDAEKSKEEVYSQVITELKKRLEI